MFCIEKSVEKCYLSLELFEVDHATALCFGDKIKTFAITFCRSYKKKKKNYNNRFNSRNLASLLKILLCINYRIQLDPNNISQNRLYLNCTIG